MSDSQESRPSVSRSTNPPLPRWPPVIGTIGIVLGVLILLDQIDDLWMLTWTEEDMRRVFAPEIAVLIAAAMRPKSWQLASTVIQMGLGLLLIVGSSRLKRRRQSAIALCRVWAWLAIAWAVAVIGWGVWLLSQYSGEIQGVSSVAWQTAAALGIGFALLLLLAFPVFLLVWLSRPEVEAEFSCWAE